MGEGNKASTLKKGNEMKNIKPFTLIVSNQSHDDINFKEDKMSASNFNISKSLAESLVAKIGKPARVDQYLHFLLDKYRILCYSGSLPKYCGIKLKYQDKANDWERVDFKPFNGDWAELRILASIHGMTMNKFFVVLLLLDLAEYGNAFGKVMEGVVPTDLLTRPIAYNQTLDKISFRLTKYSSFGDAIYQFLHEPAQIFSH